jgi:hypothetical protein
MALWGFRAAASVAIAVSLYLGITAHWPAPPAQPPALALPQVAAAEMNSYRRLWGQLAEPAGSAPWVLLSNGGGEFGYLPGVSGGSAGQLILLRCFVLGADGRTVEKVNLLLPARRAVRLLLPEAGRLAGEPLRCEVSTEGRWASFGVTVGDDPAAAGVQGRVRIGDRPAEIGQFKIDGRELRVVLQAVPLGADLG